MKTTKKRLNQKDIERLKRKIAEHLEVAPWGGLGSRSESDKKTQMFVELMETCGGQYLQLIPHHLNVLRRKLHKCVFIGNPAYHNGILSGQPHGNNIVYIVPEEKAEALLLIGLPKRSTPA